MKERMLLTILGGLLSLLSAGPWAAGMPFRPLPERPPIPADRPVTEARVALGRRLYFDAGLSFTGQVSCQSCHDLSRGGEDGRAASRGALGRLTRRSTPTLWNIGFQTIYFLDGRARTLEDAIAEHLLDPEIMAMPDEATVTGRLVTLAAYRRAFARAFGRERPEYRDVTLALAAFLRTLVTPDSPFDRYLKGDESAMGPKAVEGFGTFVDKGCAACHFWVNMAGPVPGLNFKEGEGFYELFPTFRGSDYEQRYDLLADPGRYAVTGREQDRYMWRVQSLRNIALTAPYFHNGAVADLAEAVRVMGKTQFDFDLTDHEVDAIVAFLKALTGRRPEITVPETAGEEGGFKTSEDIKDSIKTSR